MSAVLASTDQEVSFSKEWIQETARDAILEAILADVPVASEKVEVRVKLGFNTACWTYLPPHRIYVGDGIPRKARKGLSEELHRKYIASHVFHEFAHALYTERDLKQVHEELGKQIPFSLFNLFEDARIEERYRLSFNMRFDWTVYEDVKVSEDPTSLLFAFIQYEGDEEPVLELAKSADIAESLVSEVQAFYMRTVEAQSTQALYPIIRDWVERFGVPPGELGKGLDDLPLSLVLQQDARALELFEAQTIVVNGSKQKVETCSGRGEEGSVTVESVGNHELLIAEGFEISAERTRRLADRFERFFAVESRKVSTEVPSKRISVQNYIAGKPFYRRTEMKGRRRRQVLVVVDCSGSMEGFHIQEGRALIAALSDLARRGIVSGHVVLSCVLDQKACWQRFELPMPISAIQRIDAFGHAEGLEFSLRQNLKEARAADYVFVYTDGNICDAPINKRLLHSRGVYTWGLYAGDDPNRLYALTRYFDKAILRDNAERLVEAMLTHS